MFLSILVSIYILLTIWICQDEEKFFEDYAESHKKLSELGFSPPPSSCSRTTNIKYTVVGAVVAAAFVVFLNYNEIYGGDE